MHMQGHESRSVYAGHCGIDALLIQESTFRSLKCAHRLAEIARGFTLVRFRGRLEGLRQCCARFESSIVIIDKALLDEAPQERIDEVLRAARSVRLLVAIDGTETPGMLERLLLLGCYGFFSYNVGRITEENPHRRDRRGDGGETQVTIECLPECNVWAQPPKSEPP